MLERGTAAKYASPVFFQNYNDFDVYVEDTAIGYTKIYANLLARAAEEHITLDRVFPLGPRDQVIAAAEVASHTKNSRKSVFIIDGDLYLLMGENKKLPINAICLPRYCIENFLFDEETIISIIDEETHHLTETQIREQLDYNGWLTRSREPLKKLFIAYAISQKLSAGIKTVSCGYSGICLDSDGEIDVIKVESNLVDIKNSVVNKFGLMHYSSIEQEIVSNIKNDLCFLTTYVSAKDFSLPLLILRLKKISATKASNLNLKLRLSKKCDISPLKPVGVALLDIVKI